MKRMKAHWSVSALITFVVSIFAQQQQQQVRQDQPGLSTDEPPAWTLVEPGPARRRRRPGCPPTCRPLAPTAGRPPRSTSMNFLTSRGRKPARGLEAADPEQPGPATWKTPSVPAAPRRLA